MNAARMGWVFGTMLGFAIAGGLSESFAADWLSGSEREFLEALGTSYRVDGEQTRRVAKLAELPKIATRAPEPLRSRVKTISDAFGRMEISADEKRQFEALMQQGQKVVQGELLGAIFGALTGEDSFDTAVRATNGVLESGTVQQAWDLQTKWILRGLAARAVADQEMAKITGELERRVGKPLPAACLPLTLVAEQDKLCLTAKAGCEVSQPLVQVILYRKSTGGAWTALNAGSGKLLEAIGVDGMSGTTQGKGITLSVAQEMGMNLPLRATMLLPDLAAGQRVTLQLEVPVEASLGLDRAELQIWSGQGWIKQDRIDGLDIVQNAARKRMEQRQAERMAARPASPFGASFAPPPMARPSRPSLPPSASTSPRRNGFSPPTANGGVPPNGRFGFPTRPTESGMPKRGPAVSDAKTKAQQDAALNMRALRMLREAEAAVKRKQNDVARNYCNQIIALAPESPSARSAKQMLSRLDIPR